MGRGKANYTFPYLTLGHYFDSCTDGHLYGTIIHLMRCKTNVMERYPISCYGRILKVTVLQNCVDGITSIKIEDLTDVEGDEAPVKITFPAVKAENEVSCVYVYFVIHISQIFSIACCLFHPESGEWSLRTYLQNFQKC
jgi:hypothetical protein